MNIPWWQNSWNYGVVVVIFFIGFLSFSASSHYVVGIQTPAGNLGLVSVEGLYRFVFNPLWAVALWCNEQAKRVNDTNRQKIIYRLQGLLQSGNTTFTARQIFSIVSTPRDTRVMEQIEATIESQDPVESTEGNPII